MEKSSPSPLEIPPRLWNIERWVISMIEEHTWSVLVLPPTIGNLDRWKIRFDSNVSTALKRDGETFCLWNKNILLRIH